MSASPSASASASASTSKDVKEGSGKSRWRSRSRSRSRSPYSRRRDYSREDRDRGRRRYSRSRSPRSRSRSPRRRSRSRSPIRDRDARRPYPRSRSRSPRGRNDRGDGGSYRVQGRGDSDRGRGGYNGDRGGRDRGRGRGRGGGPKHESTFRGGSGGSNEPEVWGSAMAAEDEAERKKKAAIAEEDKEKPNFGLSGALAAETNTTANGVVLKYNEPPEARKPKQKWRLYVFKGDKEIDLLHIHRQSAFLFGRDRNVVDIPIDHPSCSKQHAVLQFRQIVETDSLGQASRSTKPFIIDLESANGTFVNGTQIPASRYYELKLSDVIKFGASTREFVLLHETADA
ncbi:hypothetical protein BGZ80_010778 [Entomortierella chlamydospora]|uniref:FHA domain-containing protein n=1 Tax=Entomortierella chlamydospora TaxID=101097 RepID=A0A9P6T3V5_9FUNG|nr:hypothetical protein BGZ79_001692 [Entomortierella chlamydospora]KAG0022941.1 hypothetical protein BGZ80_010778 [Entomortierella chlamydospora]